MMPKSGTFLREREAYTDLLAQSLQRVVATLSAMPEVERVCLFGSYARGRKDLFTDLDILVIMRSDQPFLERTAKLYQRLAAGVDMDLLCYTPEELERNKDRPFFRHVLREAKVLYEKKSS